MLSQFRWKFKVESSQIDYSYKILVALIHSDWVTIRLIMKNEWAFLLIIRYKLSDDSMICSCSIVRSSIELSFFNLAIWPWEGHPCPGSSYNSRYMYPDQVIPTMELELIRLWRNYLSLPIILYIKWIMIFNDTHYLSLALFWFGTHSLAQCFNKH